MTASGPGTSRYELLDAFRGAAMLAVMLMHFWVRGKESAGPWLTQWVWPVVEHGYLGVQTFFVVSGYCITAAMMGQQGKPAAIRTFVMRRARRIYPPYWWSMLLLIVLGGMHCFALRKPWFDLYPLTARDWLLNGLLVQGLFDAPDANVVYWSLSIEVQFYAVMAICLLGRTWSEIWLIVLSAVSAFLLTRPVVSVHGTVLEYWPEFACGIGAYFFVTRRNVLRVTPWATVSLSCLPMLWTITQYPVIDPSRGHFSLPWKILFCLALMLLLINCHSRDRQLSGSPWIRWLLPLGVTSYTYYLIHVPVGLRVINLGERLTGLSTPFWLLWQSLALVVTGLIGLVFFQICERPWINADASAAGSVRS